MKQKSATRQREQAIREALSAWGAMTRRELAKFLGFNERQTHDSLSLMENEGLVSKRKEGLKWKYQLSR